MDYYSAADQLTGRCKAQRKIDNNTWLIRRTDNRISLRLHATDILEFFADGKIEYFAGSWQTVTTKERLNSYGPARIWSNSGTWEINYGGITVEFFDNICCFEGKLWAPASEIKLLDGAAHELSQTIERIVSASHWATRKSAVKKATEQREQVIKLASIIEGADATKYTLPEIPLDDANAFHKWEQRMRNLRQLFVVSERLSGVKEPRLTNWLFSDTVQQWSKLEVV